ncbi:MAG: HEAT repeat domain-containing protein [Blastocatellia bacterium]
MEKQKKGFINIEGPTLKARLQTAINQGAQKRFWIGYSFDVRAGVGVEVNIEGSSGASLDFDVIVGQLGPYETRNVGIFLLYEPGGTLISRAEVYNLDLNHDFERNSVFWLGHAMTQESLDLLQELLAPAQSGDVANGLVTAVAIHDGPQPESLLRNLVNTSTVAQTRVFSVKWLGRVSDDIMFLAGIARNDVEGYEIRSQAISAIGRNSSASVLSTLRSIYDSISDSRLKRDTIDAAFKSRDREGGIEFVRHIADSDPDEQLRQYAASRLKKLKKLDKKASKGN